MEKKRCKKCNAFLNRYNSGASCWACGHEREYEMIIEGMTRAIKKEVAKNDLLIEKAEKNLNCCEESNKRKNIKIYLKQLRKRREFFLRFLPIKDGVVQESFLDFLESPQEIYEEIKEENPPYAKKVASLVVFLLTLKQKIFHRYYYVADH